MSAFNKYRLVFAIVCMIFGVLNYIAGLNQPPATFDGLIYGIVGTVVLFFGAYVLLDVLCDD